MGTASQARKTIADAIDAEHNGVYAAADASGVHFTRIYSFLRGGALEKENAGKLRAALKTVPSDVWADAYAPVSSGDEAEAQP